MLLTELQFLPPIATFRHFRRTDHLLLEARETYQKGSYRNRAYLIGANGLQLLSLPLVKGKNNSQSIREVHLDARDDWARRHWQSIRSAYGNAPFYEYYADELEPHFTAPAGRLWDFNLGLLRTVFQLLQWDKTIELTAEFQRETPESIRDLRGRIRPGNHPPGTPGDPPYAVYPQVFRERHGFVANLSILDLLFCQGPQANLYL